MVPVFTYDLKKNNNKKTEREKNSNKQNKQTKNKQTKKKQNNLYGLTNIYKFVFFFSLSVVS